MSDDTITFQYEYKVEGRDYDGKEFSSEGKARPTMPLSDFDEEFLDDELFAKATEGALQHAYSFEIEKAGLNGISEVTVTIKNVAVEYSDGQWVMNGRDIEPPKF